MPINELVIDRQPPKSVPSASPSSTTCSRAKECLRGASAGEHRPEPSLAIGRGPLIEIEVDHRTVKATTDRRSQSDGLMKRGDVAEADDRARIAADGVVVDAVEDAHRAVAAAGEEEAVEFRGPQELVEGLGAEGIVPGEVAVLAGCSDVGRESDVESRRFEFARRLFDPRHLREAQDGDVAVARKSAWKCEHAARMQTPPAQLLSC